MVTPTFFRLVPVMLAVSWGACPGYAQNKNVSGNDKLKTPKRISQAERKAAAARARKKRPARATARGGTAVQGIATTSAITAPQGGVPDYFSIDYANWAFSPPLTKFVDPLPGLCTAGGSTKCIPVAVPDKVTYPDSDYYEIELGQFTEVMHLELPATTLRGYRQTNTSDPFASQFHYLGPIIVAQKDRPVRIKFTNKLTPGSKLFLPVDTTVMGAGPGPEAWANGPTPAAPGDAICPPLAATSPTCFSENRATLHLHGGRTPWISDGTPHQWITPAGETTNYPEGASVFNVPDMPDPGPGSQTFYFTNQQSARLMFYHDHASGITRLNVYAGEAAGYVITDPAEDALIQAKLIPDATATIPLIIQDKTFVDATSVPDPRDSTKTVPAVLATDPTWNWGTGTLDSATNTRQPKAGDLWWPHVYVPAQNPYDLSGVNPTGRWAYGPWFWPPTNNIMFPPVANPYYDATDAPWEPPFMPGTPNVSWAGEAFLDTPVVNGIAYPKLAVEPKAYRFRVLNASHDRFWNLQLYQPTGIVDKVTLLSGGSGYTADPVVTVTGGGGKGATAMATVDLDSDSPTYQQVTGITLSTVGSGYTSAPTVTIEPPPSGTPATASATAYTGATEVGMLPAVLTAGFPAKWPRDGRDGGVPDPALRGPDFIQIGTEGGFLPAPAVVPNQPVVWNGNPTTFNFGNVSDHALLLAAAERADVIVDFSQFAGKTLILYNDAPAAFPALDPRLDYYTGHPDFSMATGDGTGGTTPTLAGKGPNTRTIMQINVGTTVTTPSTFSLSALQTAFASTSTSSGVFAASQDPIIVGQSAYNSTYSRTFPTTWPSWGVSRIQDNSLTFETVAGPAGTTLTVPMQPKAIHDEMGAAYDEYGRMSAKLGLEVPFTGNVNQTFVLKNYVDPPTENVTNSVTAGSPVSGDGTQIWKITHNGVDTHPVHFHLFDVQLINRVGWDGAIRLPDPNELGWKDTVRMSPLEDTIVALRPIAPRQPFGLPDSVRPLNPAMPLGATAGFTNLDINGQPLPTPTVNAMFNFGWEYVWHCHILSHEEADMMRPIAFNVGRVLPAAPILTFTLAAGKVNLTWTDGTPVGADPAHPANLGNLANEIGFRIQRAPVGQNGAIGVYAVLGTALANATAYTDAPPNLTASYAYRVVAFNAAGDAASAPVMVVPAGSPPAAPTSLAAALQSGPQVSLTWTDNATNETGFQIERRTGITGAFLPLAEVGPRTGTGSVSYIDSTVAAGNTYAYRVKAVNGGVSSAYSNTATVTIPAAPAAPTNLVTTVLTGPQVRLTWRDNATNETGFQIERAIGDGAFSTLATVGPRFFTGSVSYTDTTVTAGNSYSYRVKAVNGAVSSGYSNTANVTLASSLPAPTSLSATLLAGPQVSLTWTDNASNETGFQIERMNGGGAYSTLATVGPRTGTGAVTYTDTTVSAGNSYTYRVKAVNGGVSSAYSNTATITVSSGPPTAPGSLTATAVTGLFSDRVTLLWTDSSNNETNFTIQRATNATFTAGLNTSTAAANVVTLNQTVARRATYYYRIRANNAAGSSAWVNATPFPITTP